MVMTDVRLSETEPHVAMQCIWYDVTEFLHSKDATTCYSQSMLANMTPVFNEAVLCGGSYNCLQPHPVAASTLQACV